MMTAAGIGEYTNALQTYFGCHCLLLLGLSTTAAAADYLRSSFGSLEDGQKVEAITLTNTHGVAVRIIALGAGIQTLMVPDRNGRPADVVLGYSNLADYLAKPQYFGSTVGRFANRIAKGRFVLDGKSYQLATGTAFDFRHAKAIGRDEQILYGKGYDHNWVISREPVQAPRLVARVEEPESGRVLEVLSNQPGIQFYYRFSIAKS
jgi:galactose mutarotase-like enzyme